MADPADDVQAPEITPEDFDGDESSSKAAPSVAKVEPKARPEDSKDKGTKEVPKVDDTTGAPQEPPKGEAADKPEPSVDEKPADESDEEGEKPVDKSKGAQNRIRDLVSQRNEARAEIARLTGEAYDVKTASDLADEINPETGENYTSVEAKVEAMQQANAIAQYNADVADKQFVLGQESLQVMQDFPIFNPDSDSFDEELAVDAARLLEANLIRDNNVPEIGPDGKPSGKGLIIGSNVSPYTLYKTLARASGTSAVKGQIKGQSAAEKQLANVDAPTSAAPPQKDKDPLEVLWSEPL